jgi:hypothetical protein
MPLLLRNATHYLRSRVIITSQVTNHRMGYKVATLDTTQYSFVIIILKCHNMQIGLSFSFKASGRKSIVFTPM